MYYKTILLDMDEVIANFTVAAVRAHGREDLLATWPRGEYAISKVLGISPEELWSKLNREEFWAREVQPYPGAKRFVQYLKGMGYRIHVVTVAGGDIGVCTAGKLQFLKDHFNIPSDVVDVFTSSSDKLCRAHAGSILIDDNRRTCELFWQNHYQAVEFPAIHSDHPEFISLYEVNYLYALEEIQRIEKITSKLAEQASRGCA